MSKNILYFGLFMVAIVSVYTSWKTFNDALVVSLSGGLFGALLALVLIKKKVVEKIVGRTHLAFIGVILLLFSYVFLDLTIVWTYDQSDVDFSFIIASFLISFSCFTAAVLTLVNLKKGSLGREIVLIVTGVCGVVSSLGLFFLVGSLVG